MPQVPGTKVWIKKADLHQIVKLMDIDNPPERMVRAIDFAKLNVRRCSMACGEQPKVVATAYGESESLGLKSKPEDSQWLTKMLNFDY